MFKKKKKEYGMFKVKYSTETEHSRKKFMRHRIIIHFNIRPTRLILENIFDLSNNTLGKSFR